MCTAIDPISATALAMTLGGTYLEQKQSDKNARRQQHAREGAFREYQDQQARFADESRVAFNDSISQQGRDNFDQQRQIEGDNLKQAFGDVRVEPDYNTGLRASAPKNVILARQAAGDKATAETDRDVEGLSKLSGYGGAMFNQGLGRSEFARLFGNIQDKAGVNTALLPMNMQSAATNASKTPSLFPSLMKYGGQALGLYNAAGGFTKNLGNQKVDMTDYLNKGARSDIAYAKGGGFGPYRF